MDLPFERTLVFAPHPDDESIGTGGLLAHLAHLGATIRAVYLTDGDNNPWPQRACRRRWVISARKRRAWGLLRRREARRALSILGIAPSSATFLGFPDDGLAALYRHNRDILVKPLAKIICEFRPTLLVIPSPQDFHPDHRATYRATLRALFPPEMYRPQLAVSYVVHGRPNSHDVARIAVCADDHARKRMAVECHKTQLLLSRRRFMEYAARDEALGIVKIVTVRDESPLARWRAKLRHVASVLR